MGMLRRMFGSRKMSDEEMSEEQKRKKRKRTLRNVKQVRYGDSRKKRAMMDEITDIEQYQPRRRRA